MNCDKYEQLSENTLNHLVILLFFFVHKKLELETFSKDLTAEKHECLDGQVIAILLSPFLQGMFNCQNSTFCLSEKLLNFKFQGYQIRWKGFSKIKINI